MGGSPLLVRLFVAFSFVMLAAAPALGQLSPDGHWENLGEDGWIFVPHGPSAAGYLPPPDLGAYRNFAEMEVAVHVLAANYPHLVTLASAGKSAEGRDLWYVTITAPGGGAKPAVFYDGAHHGDEVIGSEVILKFAEELASRYGFDSEITSILDSTSITLLPMVNPDGIARAHNSTWYGDARKNAKSVDLNRNYRYGWGGPGSSGSKGDATYRGPSAESESETRAVSELLDSRDWSFYVSVHSGARIILWPWGNTSARPQELGVYQEVGSRLTGLTGVRNGQISRDLYLASGVSVDHAYGGTKGWRPIAFTPETFQGSGHANDWWYLFNPSDSKIESTYATWRPMFLELAAKAGAYGPATLVPSGAVDTGPDPFTVSGTVKPSSSRPLLGAKLHAEAGSRIEAQSPNPVALADGSSERQASFQLYPLAGGHTDLVLRLDAGPQGHVRKVIPVDARQATLTLDLDRSDVGSYEDVTARIVIDAGPFVDFDGKVKVTLDGPAKVDAGSKNVSGEQGKLTFVNVTFNTEDLPVGRYTATARLDFNGTYEGATKAAHVLDRDAFNLHRPQLVVEKAAPSVVKIRDEWKVRVTVRNVGDLPAEGIELRELMPHGYVLSVTPGTNKDRVFSTPPPALFGAAEDGRVAVVYGVPGLAPGGSWVLDYKMRALLPLEARLESRVAYEHDYGDHVAEYAASFSVAVKATT